MDQTRSFPTASKVFKISLFSVLPFLFFGCAQSEAQREFREQALMPPSGITAMNANGSRVENGESDPDDWRTAPDFAGSFSIETPAYPNPVTLSDQLQLLVSINSYQAVQGLQVYAFRQPGQSVGPLYSKSGQLETGFLDIRIDTDQFASSTGTGNFGNLYRIIIYDANLNVISYGDVEVQ